MKKVTVLMGAGSIGLAIVRRVAAGGHIVLADYNEANAAAAAKTLEEAGFDCSTLKADLGSCESILEVIRHARRADAPARPMRWATWPNS